MVRTQFDGYNIPAGQLESYRQKGFSQDPALRFSLDGKRVTAINRWPHTVYTEQSDGSIMRVRRIGNFSLRWTRTRLVPRSTS